MSKKSITIDIGTTKKEKGTIQLLYTHLTNQGKKFKKGQRVKYTGINKRKKKCCGDILFETYITEFGLIPTAKGKKI